MSASLVGSEMCIRDRGGQVSARRARARPLVEAVARLRRRSGRWAIRGVAVSYTHLTLPTICSV
eukprot:2909979-Alexandrium_andersonii.AAC.1